MSPWIHALSGNSFWACATKWAVQSMPTRGDDPVYLRHVERFWREAQQQVQGLLWRDGGPVVGHRPDALQAVLLTELGAGVAMADV